MSVVEQKSFLSKYFGFSKGLPKKHHRVFLGISAWTRENLRNAFNLSKLIEYDIWCVKNISFILNLSILYRIVLKVMKFEGVNAVNMFTT